MYFYPAAQWRTTTLFVGPRWKYGTLTVNSESISHPISHPIKELSITGGSVTPVGLDSWTCYLPESNVGRRAHWVTWSSYCSSCCSSLNNTQTSFLTSKCTSKGNLAFPGLYFRVTVMKGLPSLFSADAVQWQKAEMVMGRAGKGPRCPARQLLCFPGRIEVDKQFCGGLNSL